MVGDTQNAAPFGWLKATGFYVVHALISTVGVFFVALFVGAGIEHFINTKIGDALFAGPAFPAEITLGFLAGFFINKRLQSQSAKWAWVAFFAFVVFSEIPSKESWVYIARHLFGTQCGDCIEQLFMVGPLYSSLAYSVGAWVAIKYSLRKH